MLHGMCTFRDWTKLMQGSWEIGKRKLSARTLKFRIEEVHYVDITGKEWIIIWPKRSYNYDHGIWGNKDNNGDDDTATMSRVQRVTKCFSSNHGRVMVKERLFSYQGLWRGLCGTSGIFTAMLQIAEWVYKSVAMFLMSLKI